MTAPEREPGQDTLDGWRQGDCVLGPQRFVSRADPDRPLTGPSREACDPESGLVETEVPGFAVLTQTCDLVRAWDLQPFVEVAPLIRVDPSHWREAARGRRPRLAAVPGLENEGLVADLDRVMTVEKAVVATWTRHPGCRDDDEARRFALALARKRARFAFPDDFVAWVRPLQNQLVGKHDKNSSEGRALRTLREIRVRAAPSWDAGTVELTFTFIRDAGAEDFEGTPWYELLERWLERVPAGGRFHDVDGLVLPLDHLTARDYVESDPLDLAYLSDRPA